MTAYAGSASASALLLYNTNVSTDLRTGLVGADLAYRPLRASAPMSTGAPVLNEPIDVSPANAAPVAGAKSGGPGDTIFERIHIIPNLKTIPFILSDSHITVEVWNAFRETAEVLTSAVLSGPAGVSIVSGGLAGVNYAPLQSRLFDILVAAAGAPRADNTITFTFPGLTPLTFYVSGLRLLPFTIAPDWSAGVVEDLHYLTDVMVSYDTTEQRMQLRAVPARSLAFTALAADELEAALLMSLLWAWQGRSYGVPQWHNGAPLGADLGASAVDIMVDTTVMEGLAAGDTVMVFADAFRWFASTVQSFTAGSIRLDTGTDQAFIASQSQVLPIALGRLPDSLPTLRPTNMTASLAVKFELEVVPLAPGGPS